MDIVFLIGRIIFGGFWIYNGINHLTHTGMLAQHAASKGVPVARLSVTVAGFMILFGGLGVLFGVYTSVSLSLIAVFLLVVTFSIHDFWKATDPQQRMADQISFGKNMALLAATLMLFAIATPWVFSL